MEAFHELRTTVLSLQYHDIIAYLVIATFLYVSSHNLAPKCEH